MAAPKEITVACAIIMFILKIWLRSREKKRKKRQAARLLKIKQWELQRQRRRLQFLKSQAIFWKRYAEIQQNLMLHVQVMKGIGLQRQHKVWVKGSCKSAEWSEKLLNNTWLDEDYVTKLRVNKYIFEQICEDLKDLMLTVDTNMRPAISVKIKIASSLYYLAENCSLQTVANLFGLGKESVRRSLYLFCDSLLKYYSPIYLKKPDVDYLLNAATAFATNFTMPCCIGAIGGCHIPIVCPFEDKKADNHSGKQLYSVVLQGVVNAQGVFWNVDVGWPGEVHDTRDFTTSNIFNQVYAEDFLPKSNVYINDIKTPYYLVGDGTYPLLEWLMNPFEEVNNLTTEQIKYNEFMSSMHVVAELAFGRYKGRWRRLLKRSDLGLVNTKKVIVSCCILHNMCEINNVPFIQELVVNESKPNFKSITNFHNSPSEFIRKQLVSFCGNL